MTNYNERLDEILNGFGLYSRWYGFDEAFDTKGKHTSSTPTEAITNAKQAITSLIKELVAEAKPKLPALFTELNDISVIMYKKGTDEFEQNLLKALEEV